MQRSVRLLLVWAAVALVGATGAALWLTSGRPPRYGPLASAERRREDASVANTVSERVHLRSVTGRRVTCTLRRPAEPEPTRRSPAILLFGGIGTGRRAAQLVGPEHAVVILACDYPWEDPSRLSFWRLVPRLRTIRAEVLATPEALTLAASYLVELPEVDPRRLAGVGASLGVPFISAWAARDARVAAVALVYGGGEIGALFEANLRRTIGVGALRWLVARAAAGLLGELDPARTVGRIAPRPLLLVGSRQDDRVPARSVEALVRSARGPVTTVWFPGRHMVPSDTMLLRAVADSTVAWLSRTVLRLSPPALPGELR